MGGPQAEREESRKQGEASHSPAGTKHTHTQADTYTHTQGETTGCPTCVRLIWFDTLGRPDLFLWEAVEDLAMAEGMEEASSPPVLFVFLSLVSEETALSDCCLVNTMWRCQRARIPLLVKH